MYRWPVESEIIFFQGEACWTCLTDVDGSQASGHLIFSLFYYRLIVLSRTLGGSALETVVW